MALWPRDERTENKTSSKQSVGEKRRDYPFLEPGLIGAATLTPKSFGWTFFSNPLLPERSIIERRLKCRGHLEIFPPTRAVPQKKSERVSIKRGAEQGANFLRVYLPDIEVASELIREKLSEDITLSRKFERFDPYSGNVLEAFRNASNPRLSCILFPTGETNRDLNSCLVDISDHSVTFSPRADSLCSFPTPVQHLALSKRLDANNLAVRTFGSLQLFTLRYAEDDESLIMDAHSSLSRSDFADETVVDMKFSSASPNLLTVGHKGSLFETDFSSGTQAFNQLHQVDCPGSREIGSEFWRLSLDKNVHNRFVLSPKETWQFDIRTSSSNNILCLTAGKHVFTAIEDVHQENLLQLCSTHSILWVDLRFPGTPLLAYAHEREYDRYLSTTTVNYPGQGSLTFLSCRSNGLMTVYDVSHSNDGLIRLDQPPYGLSSPNNLYDKHVGQQFLEGGKGLGLLQLSERGGVSYQDIVLNTGQIERKFVVRKSKHMREMEDAVPNLEDEGTLGAGHYSQVNMHEKYNALFNQGLLKKPDKHSAESLDRMLQLFPCSMQNHELPIEHILTTYDVAFRAGDEPQYPGRADFLTESVLNSTMVYEALKDGRLAPAQVKASWHRSIASTFERLDEDFRSDPQELMEHLQQFNLSGDNVPEYARELEKEACQQLVSDLALTSDIFSETKFSKAREVQSLETMTEALSLGGDPPPIEFGYLQPLAPRPKSHEIDDDTPMQQPEIPPGVRLLLKDWGDSDQDGYVHRDPFSGIGSPISKVTAVHDLYNVVIQNQRPPPILPSNAVALKGQLQEPTPSAGFEGIQVPPSQDFAIKTQVLPGPFGGRPMMKKKPTKKRLGGF